jgi:DNA replication factor GINS
MEINLGNILREERKSKLVPLEAGFYGKVKEYLESLEGERSKTEDQYSTKSLMIEDELKSARKYIENIIALRTAKIVREVSLRVSSRESQEKQYLEAMTPEERGFYEQLYELMKNWRGSLLEPILKSKSYKKDAKEAKTESSLGKKDINKEYVVVRLLRDVPTFLGIDGRSYTLAKEDVAVLPIVNAKVLINRNAALLIRNK